MDYIYHCRNKGASFFFPLVIFKEGGGGVGLYLYNSNIYFLTYMYINSIQIKPLLWDGDSNKFKFLQYYGELYYYSQVLRISDLPLDKCCHP